MNFIVVNIQMVSNNNAISDGFNKYWSDVGPKN